MQGGGLEKSDDKVNPSFIVSFSLPTGEKNVTDQSKMLEVADTYGSLPRAFAIGLDYRSRIS